MSTLPPAQRLVKGFLYYSREGQLLVLYLAKAALLTADLAQ
jgi:hypothetical protein